MPGLHETRIGQVFFDVTLPRIANALETIAAGMEKGEVDGKITKISAVLDEAAKQGPGHFNDTCCAILGVIEGKDA
jgi:hypothetical protein